MTIKRTCLFCGQVFFTKPSKVKKGEGKYCSRRCTDKGKVAFKTMSGENHPAWKGGQVTKTCLTCGDTFMVDPGRANEAMYCSTKCFGVANSERIAVEGLPWDQGGKTVKMECIYCGKIFSVFPYEASTRKSCSRRCSDKWRSKTYCGPNTHTWRGGISYNDYNADFNRPLKRLIRERDDFTCQLCGHTENGRKHDCHHIDYDKLNNEPSNLIILCRSCHGLTQRRRKGWQALFSHWQDVRHGY